MDGSIILLKTVKKGNGHTHIVAINNKTGEGQTSKTKDHTHIVRFVADTRPTLDGGMVPEGSGRWMLEPAENHTHEAVPYVPEPKQDKEDDEKIVADCLQLFRVAKDIEKEARDDAKASIKFYRGEQWDAQQKSMLEKAKRACLTINQTEPKVDLLSGYQRQNRTDIKYMPTEEGDQRISEVLNIVSKNILENCNFRFEETEVFEDGVIGGRGLFHIFADFSRDIRGDVIVEKFEWDDVYFGPHVKKDLSDCEYLVKTKWYSRSKVEKMYPDKKALIGQEFDDSDEKEVREPVGDKYAYTDNKIIATTDPDLIDLSKKQVRLLEVWRKEYKRSYVVANPDADFYYNASDWSEGDIKALGTITMLTVLPYVEHRMRMTKLAAEVLLDDEYPDLATQDFDIIPFYAKKRGDYFWGKIHPVKDPQREVNKRHSQLVDIMNRQAAYGWFYDDGTFPDKTEVENFRSNSSAPGFIQRISSIKSLPEKIEGAKVPTEIIQLLQIEDKMVRDIFNVNLEMEGNQSNAQSGIAILERKKQGLVGNEFLFDNLSLAKAKIGRLLVAYIQKYYTPERMMRILGNENAKAPITIGGQPFQDPMKEELFELLKESDLTKYDVTVAESGWSPTTRIANATMWFELAAKGARVPMPFLIELSDLPEKDKVLQMFAAESQQRAQVEQDKNAVEIEKTKIAAMSKLMSGGKSAGDGSVPS
jgi:hypothetical protein